MEDDKVNKVMISDYAQKAIYFSLSNQNNSGKLKQLGNRFSRIENLSKEQVLKLKEYLQIAERDLKDYQILFSNGSYANAVYHLEQSIEKIAKIFYFIISDNPDPKKIGHKSLKVYIKLLEENEEFFSFIFDNKLNDGINLLKDFVNDNKKEKIAQLSFSELKTIKENIELFKKDITSEFKKILDLFSNNKGLESNFIGKIEINKNYSKFIITYMINFFLIYLFSIIIWPHESLTRYPDYQVKPSDYILGFGIVDFSSYMSTEMQAIINWIEEVIDKQK